MKNKQHCITKIFKIVEQVIDILSNSIKLTFWLFENKYVLQAKCLDDVLLNIYVIQRTNIMQINSKNI